MSDQKHLAILDQLVDAFNDHDAQRLADLHSEDANLFNAVTNPAKEGREQIREFFEGIFAGWPDCRWEKTRAFGQDDLLCMEWTFTGSSANHPEAPINMWDSGVFKVANGEIVETRFYIDTGTIAKQWGAQGVV